VDPSAVGLRPGPRHARPGLRHVHARPGPVLSEPVNRQLLPRQRAQTSARTARASAGSSPPSSAASSGRSSARSSARPSAGPSSTATVATGPAGVLRRPLVLGLVAGACAVLGVLAWTVLRSPTDPTAGAAPSVLVRPRATQAPAPAAG